MNFYTSDHPLLTFVIGLPGSGKSTLFNHIESNPFIDFKIYDDWLVTYKNNCGLGSFNCDTRYEELVDHLKSGRNCVVSCIDFCDSDFLSSTISIIMSCIPEVHPKLLYFENDFKSCIHNVKVRDINNGGHWVKVNDNTIIYHGDVDIPTTIPIYKLSISKIIFLSESYVIPYGYTPIKIKSHKMNGDYPHGYLHDS